MLLCFLLVQTLSHHTFINLVDTKSKKSDKWRYILEKTVWHNSNFYLQVHDSKLPWLKLFTSKKYKELTELPKDIKVQMYELLEVIELVIIEYYTPDKVNLASFGNMLPHLHWHIIARFKNDPYFPKTTWEEPVREFNLELPSFNGFIEVLQKRLNAFEL
ncbi:MAG TPA: HIT family protein [Nitratifractor sp.]|nr:HIT family protein [Nitratifractor sp.]